MIDVAPPDPRVYPILAEAGFSSDLFNERQHRAHQLVDAYTLEVARALLGTLGLEALLAEPRSVMELVAARGFAPVFERPLAWLLAYLADAGTLAAGDGTYRLRGNASEPALAAVRSAVLDADASYAPALALLDEAAAIYPRVARGETSGERALFLRARLWVDYFDNANGYYGLTNRIAAHAAATRLPPCSPPMT
jgi:hypothetical protein